MLIDSRALEFDNELESSPMIPICERFGGRFMNGFSAFNCFPRRKHIMLRGELIYGPPVHITDDTPGLVEDWGDISRRRAAQWVGVQGIVLAG